MHIKHACVNWCMWFLTSCLPLQKINTDARDAAASVPNQAKSRRHEVPVKRSRNCEISLFFRRFIAILPQTGDWRLNLRNWILLIIRKIFSRHPVIRSLFLLPGISLAFLCAYNVITIASGFSVWKASVVFVY